MATPRFSIVIPTYNRPQYLAEAVASVQAQTVTDFECLIVDDAGPVPAVAPPDPRFRVIRRQENGGQAASFNTGLSAARGEFVAFLDDDDRYLPERLQIALEGLAQAPIAACLCRMFGEGFTRPISDKTWNGNLAFAIRERSAPQLGMAAVVRSRALPFDEALRACADVDWWLRMAQHNTFCTIPRLGLLYRLHATPRHSSNSGARVRALQQIYDKHRGYFVANRKARGFHFRQMALNAMKAGRAGQSLALFGRSLAAYPSPVTAGICLKALLRRPEPR